MCENDTKKIASIHPETAAYKGVQRFFTLEALWILTMPAIPHSTLCFTIWQGGDKAF